MLGKQRLNRTQNYGSKGLQGCEIRIIKMWTVIVLHEANFARFYIPMEVNMNSTVLLEATPSSLVYTITSVYKHRPSRGHIPEDGFPVIFYL
jgi:dTDP-4-dehydrorhamnose 3,5-epimerase-like enzyme